jgi:predicted esterase
LATSNLKTCEAVPLKRLLLSSQDSPSHEHFGEAETVWQKPVAAVGVLLLLHGCSHSATDFFPASDSCPSCIGLPEELRITQAALHRNYAVIAISSSDRKNHKCWQTSFSHRGPSADIQNIKDVLEVWLPREGIKDLPMYALGASSGGSFALALPVHIPLAGVCAQIAALPLEVFERLFTQIQEGNSGSTVYPPTYLIHMPRDTFTRKHVRLAAAYLADQKVPVHQVLIEPRPITATFLAERLPTFLDQAAAEQLVQEFKAAGLLGKDSGMLLENPRGSGWREVVAKSPSASIQKLPTAADKSGLSELLNLAWAGHEIVSDGTDAVLAWFEQQGKNTKT